MAIRSQGAGTGWRPAFAAHLRALRTQARRAVVLTVLALTGLWLSFALSLDRLFEGLAHDWRSRAEQAGRRPLPPLLAVAMRPATWACRASGAVAGAVRSISAPHARFAARIDARLLVLAG